MIKIYRDKHNNANYVVQSTCTEPEAFMAEFAEAITALAKTSDDYAVFSAMKVGMPVLYKLSGYKADNVREQRTLICGDVSPELCDVISSAGR